MKQLIMLGLLALTTLQAATVSTYHVQLTGTITDVEVWTDPEWEKLGYDKAAVPVVGEPWWMRIDTSIPDWDGSRITVVANDFRFGRPEDQEGTVIVDTGAVIAQNIWPGMYGFADSGFRMVLENYQVVSVEAGGGFSGRIYSLYAKWENGQGTAWQEYNNFVEYRFANVQIDNAEMVHTPEPATLGITGLALLAAVAIAKRRGPGRG